MTNEEDENVEVVRNALQFVCPSTPNSLEVDDVDDSNEWTKLIAEQCIRREKIRSNVKVVAALAEEIRVLREQLSIAPTKSTKGSSFITPPRHPTRSPPRSPPRSADGGNEELNMTLGVDDVHRLCRGVISSGEDDQKYTW